MTVSRLNQAGQQLQPESHELVIVVEQSKNESPESKNNVSGRLNPYKKVVDLLRSGNKLNR